jgi:hypothetical protein
MIKLELDEGLNGDLAIIQVPWYVFNRFEDLARKGRIVVIMGHTSDYLVVAGNPARLYEVAGFLHEALHRLYEPDLD